MMNKNQETKTENERFPVLAEIVDFEELNSGKKKFEEETVKFLAEISLKFFEGIAEAQDKLGSAFLFQKSDDIFEIFEKGAHLSSEEVAGFFQKNVDRKIMTKFTELLDSNIEKAKEWEEKADQESKALFEEFLNSILEEGKSKFFETINKMNKETK